MEMNIYLFLMHMDKMIDMITLIHCFKYNNSFQKYICHINQMQNDGSIYFITPSTTIIIGKIIYFSMK